MAFLDTYRQQVTLLIRTIPFVAKETAFALKGGTAINLFVRDMPRLSVDIDLTYLPVEDRTTSLAAIDAAMLRIAERIEAGIPGAKVNPSRSADEKIVTKLIVRAGGVQIKIEITPVLRGTVYDPVVTPVVPAVEDEFGFAEMQVVSFADLYAGKIVAALDRQHPRDLFDVRDLLAHEVLETNSGAHSLSISSATIARWPKSWHRYESHWQRNSRGFVGMTQEPVALVDLEVAREAIIAAMIVEMPDAHRHFLVGFKRGEPDWELLGIQEAQRLPAVLWKQRNLDRLPAGKRRELADRLAAMLHISHHLT